MTSTTRTRSTQRRIIPIGLAVLSLIAVAVAVAIAWLVGGDAPQEVSIDAARDAISTVDQTAGDQTAGDTTATSTAASTTTDGTWVVDPTVTGSPLDGGGSFAGFRIAEELAGIGATEAVGRTATVTGGVVLDGETLVAAEVTADLTAIVSDEARRGNAIQRALNTGTHPTATFVLTEPVDVGEIAVGEVVAVEVRGTLTVNGVTRDVVVPVTAVLEGDTVVLTASVDVTFADHGVSVPSAPIVLSVADHGLIEIQLYLVRA